MLHQQSLWDEGFGHSNLFSRSWISYHFGVIIAFKPSMLPIFWLVLVSLIARLFLLLFEHNVRLTPLDGTLLFDATLYWQFVGSLVYLTLTQPKITYVVNLFSQFMVSPQSTHYATILRYVKSTIFHGLYYSASSSLVLHHFSDVDWVNDPDWLSLHYGLLPFLEIPS